MDDYKETLHKDINPRSYHYQTVLNFKVSLQKLAAVRGVLYEAYRHIRKSGKRPQVSETGNYIDQNHSSLVSLLRDPDGFSLITLTLAGLGAGGRGEAHCAHRMFNFRFCCFIFCRT